MNKTNGSENMKVSEKIATAHTRDRWQTLKTLL